MSTRGDQRRGLQGLTNDPWRKLVALALAIGLWFWLDSKVTTSKDQQCELQTVNSIREVLLDSSNAVVAILVPRDYSKRGFRDAVSDEEITGVTLRFEGPSGLISNIGRNEQFWVEPTGRQLNPDNTSFEFDAEDIRFRDDELKDALHSMMPERVRVVLDPTGTEELRLSHEMVRIEYPAAGADGDWGTRLVPQNSTFEPETVVVRGTIDALAGLRDDVRSAREGQDTPVFVVDLSRFGQLGSTTYQVKQQIELQSDLRQRGLEIESGAVIVTIPLRPSYVEYDLLVAVQLIDNSGAFEQPDKVKVTLNAAGGLDATLSGRSEESLAEWADENLRVLAVLPRESSLDPGSPIVPTNTRLVFIKNVDWKKGVDYTARLSPLTVTPKKSNDDG